MATFSWLDKLKKRNKDTKLEAISIPRSDEGAVDIDRNNSYDMYSSFKFDLDQVPSEEYDLIQKYRELALHPVVEDAIDEIVNEAVVNDNYNDIVYLNLDKTDLSENIKKKITTEFEHILKIMSFKTKAYGYFRKWYIDGRIYFQKIIDKDSMIGVVEIDPIRLKLVREYTSKKDANGIVTYTLSDIDEYYLFFKDKVSKNSTDALRISKEAIASATSGLLSADGKIVLSNLYKIIKPLNHLNLLESSLVIYRITRAPEKRAFYIGTGGLPAGKVSQYINDIMNRFRNKVAYDPVTGTITSDKKFQSIIEDYWIPRKSSGDGTSIESIQGASNLGETDDVEIFQKNFYRSLKVPFSRFQTETGFNLGKSTEITRDEVRFNKFVIRLRNNFSAVFNDLLYTQLMLKKIITHDEWINITEDLHYVWNQDNYFYELKDLDVLTSQVDLYSTMLNAGVMQRFFTDEWVHKNIFKHTDEDIKKIKDQSEIEKKENPNEEERY